MRRLTTERRIRNLESVEKQIEKARKPTALRVYPAHRSLLKVGEPDSPVTPVSPSPSQPSLQYASWVPAPDPDCGDFRGFVLLQIGLGCAWLEKGAGHELGTRGTNIERAIECFKRATQFAPVGAQQVDPIHSATAHMWLGNALRDRVSGSRSRNLREAIQLYRMAKPAFPETPMGAEGLWTTLLEEGIALAALHSISGDEADFSAAATQMRALYDVQDNLGHVLRFRVTFSFAVFLLEAHLVDRVTKPDMALRLLFLAKERIPPALELGKLGGFPRIARHQLYWRAGVD